MDGKGTLHQLHLKASRFLRYHTQSQPKWKWRAVRVSCIRNSIVRGALFQLPLFCDDIVIVIVATAVLVCLLDEVR